MLRITKAEDQATRLVMRLAAAGEQLTLGQLAELESLPEPTVAKLLGQLRRGGVVEAARGRHGGYTLAAPAGEISTARVLRALGGDPAPDHPCVSNPENSGGCPRTGDCGLRAVWRHLQQQVAELLDQTSVADLLRLEHSVDAQLQGVWPLIEDDPDDRDSARTLSEGA
ncbi:MAG TPA: Rrf2 family transcriptional regulator [Candidatus Krumholzibacteria bacterium]|nr:Rrf2 family transcriptional regulator [Candidatus Krumholzibacteria bacterium]HPD71171.1 Rrf2 family transcriptional regulator [Candidatus Krumholzibacteria bacterium]HRY39129.1 Rrf2 family transcriptional regulator [Candidatus Krumholzibacteria bacterium]